MKAILVLDVPDYVDFNLCKTVDVGLCFNVKEYTEPFIKSNVPLKPMPMKRETQIHWKSIGGGDIPTHEISDYDKGWNDCVDFLEGELND